MTRLIERVKEYADYFFPDLKEDDVLHFILVFRRVGLDILIEKVKTSDHDSLFETFAKHLAMYQYKKDKIADVQTAIWNFLIEESKIPNGSHRWSALSALADSGYDYKSYFEELLKTETGALIKSLLQAHLTPVKPVVGNNNGMYYFPNLINLAD